MRINSVRMCPNSDQTQVHNLSRWDFSAISRFISRFPESAPTETGGLETVIIVLITADLSSSKIPLWWRIEGMWGGMITITGNHLFLSIQRLEDISQTNLTSTSLHHLWHYQTSIFLSSSCFEWVLSGAGDKTVKCVFARRLFNVYFHDRNSSEMKIFL